MNRADVIRMAQEAAGDYSKDDFWPMFTEELEAFAALVAAHVLAQRAPSIVLSTADIDPALLRDMLAKAKPMPIVAMPPEPDVAAAVLAAREACAKILDANAACCTQGGMMGTVLVAAADAIRARGAP